MPNKEEGERMGKTEVGVGKKEHSRMKENIFPDERKFIQGGYERKKSPVLNKLQNTSKDNSNTQFSPSLKNVRILGLFEDQIWSEKDIFLREKEDGGLNLSTYDASIVTANKNLRFEKDAKDQ